MFSVTLQRADLDRDPGPFRPSAPQLNLCVRPPWQRSAVRSEACRGALRRSSTPTPHVRALRGRPCCPVLVGVLQLDPSRTFSASLAVRPRLFLSTSDSRGSFRFPPFNSIIADSGPDELGLSELTSIDPDLGDAITLLSSRPSVNAAAAHVNALKLLIRVTNTSANAYDVRTTSPN